MSITDVKTYNPEEGDKNTKDVRVTIAFREKIPAPDGSGKISTKELKGKFHSSEGVKYDPSEKNSDTGKERAPLKSGPEDGGIDIGERNSVGSQEGAPPPPSSTTYKTPDEELPASTSTPLAMGQSSNSANRKYCY